MIAYGLCNIWLHTGYQMGSFPCSDVFGFQIDFVDMYFSTKAHCYFMVLYRIWKNPGLKIVTI